MRRVAVTDGMAQEAVKKLESAGCEVVQAFIEHEHLVDGALADFDAIIVRSATKLTNEMLEASQPRLKVVARAGVGVDNIDLDAASRLGLPVVNAPERVLRALLNSQLVIYCLRFDLSHVLIDPYVTVCGQKRNSRGQNSMENGLASLASVELHKASQTWLRRLEWRSIPTIPITHMLSQRRLV